MCLLIGQMLYSSPHHLPPPHVYHCFVLLSVTNKWWRLYYSQGTLISTVLINGCGLEDGGNIKSVPTKSCHETRTRIQTSWHKTHKESRGRFSRGIIELLYGETGMNWRRGKHAKSMLRKVHAAHIHAQIVGERFPASLQVCVGEQSQ